MNWAEETARKLIEKHPNKEVFTVASGVSPSGYIHIGNFREIVTTFFVAHELKKLGKKVRYILSFDDYDRFRKVPAGIPTNFEKYIGMPYSAIPSPVGSDETYAQYLEDFFAKELEKVGIFPEFIYQTKEYQSGRYLEEIKLSMSKRFEIFDILAKYKTQELTDEERNSYYPISVYCEECQKDSTIVKSYNEENGDIEYSCECGTNHTININTAKNIKLAWKIDWPMRWKVEDVVFEPGGRDHSAANGSYVIGKEIAKEIFNYEAPDYVAYDFIGIKGGSSKMSSSTGNVLTLTDLLKVYDKNLVLWFYAKYKPATEFTIALDNDVIRYYSEFDRMVKAKFAGTLDEKNSSILSLTDVTEDYLNYPNFSYLATFLPVVNYNVEMLKKLLENEGIDCSNKYFEERMNLAKNWIELYGENYRVTLVNEFNTEYYETLSELEKKWIEKTITILDTAYNTSDEIQTVLYAVVKEDITDEKEIKSSQKRYFQTLYNLLLGNDQGPKLGLLLAAFSKDELKKRLDVKNN